MKNIKFKYNIIFEKHLLPAMTADQKKALLLLKYIIFNYHGLDEEEKKYLEKSAEDIEGLAELKWVEEFVSNDA
ncbi:MAG: hypothetical protein ACJ75J_13480, partial [Cytophagaceae bacterium]